MKFISKLWELLQAIIEIGIILFIYSLCQSKYESAIILLLSIIYSTLIGALKLIVISNAAQVLHLRGYIKALLTPKITMEEYIKSTTKPTPKDTEEEEGIETLKKLKYSSYLNP
jgi:hypothetical protein